MEKDLGSGLTKPATIVMLAEFENGRATITMRAQQRRRSDEALARNVQATGEVPSRAQRRNGRAHRSRLTSRRRGTSAFTSTGSGKWVRPAPQ